MWHDFCYLNFVVQILQIKAVDKVTVFSLFMIYVFAAISRAFSLLILRPQFSEPAIGMNKEEVLCFPKQVWWEKKYYDLKEVLFF